MGEYLIMNAPNLIESLERFGRSLPVVVQGVPGADAKWKPADGAWSILEIVMHLCDEEVDDFRTRVRLTLEDASRAWPEIHPSQWAIDRKYNEPDLGRAVERFVHERQHSVEWLRGLGSVDWSMTHTLRKLGAMRAGDLLAAWAAHDALHLRQIAKRMHQLAQHHAGEFAVGYAGDWTT